MFKNQPRGFSIFFLTEIWERYGFYTLQTLLLFYGINKFHLNDVSVYSLIGSFTALAYINSMFGGIIADKCIGYNKSIVVGGLLLFIGYSLLMNGTQEMFLFGLASISSGTGLLKPNISSMLSTIYKSNKYNKESGYTVFYVGIYCGAIAGSLLGSYIQKYLGWSFLFGTAAVGSLIAVATFLYGTNKFTLEDDRKINGNPFIAFISILLLIMTSYFGLSQASNSDMLFVVISIFCAGVLIFNILKYKGVARQKLIAFSALILVSVVYWTIYFQQFFSVGLCIERITEHNMTVGALESFESIGVIIFGPIVSYIIIMLQKRQTHFSIPAKFASSLLCNGISFFILSMSIYYAMVHHIKEAQAFIIVCYLVIALGELFISPVGLSMVSTLVPKKLTGLMMGVFLMSIGFGGKLAGIIAQLSSNNNVNATLFDLESTYLNSFAIYTLISLGIFVICMLIKKPLNQYINAVDTENDVSILYK